MIPEICVPAPSTAAQEPVENLRQKQKRLALPPQARRTNPENGFRGVSQSRFGTHEQCIRQIIPTW